MAATPTPSTYHLFVGIDIAAATAAVALARPGQRPDRAFTIPQSPTGFTQLQQRLQESGVLPAATLVVLEATGSYWLQLAHYLYQADYRVSVVNPKQAHDFAQALRQPGKSDPLDAAALAELGAKLQPALWTPPPAIYQQLAQRIGERDDLLALRTQVQNQLHALAQQPLVVEAVRARKQALLATLDGQIAALDAELEAELATEPAWACSVRLLQSIPGVGLLTAVVVVVSTLNFTRCPSVAAATRYAGLDPEPYESGTSVRGRARLKRGGHARLRTALYMATLSAARYNPVIRELYARLRAAGKAHKVARCAAARKLLHLAWAVVKKGQVFDAEYGKQGKVLPQGA
jgi:transposase